MGRIAVRRMAAAITAAIVVGMAGAASFTSPAANAAPGVPNAPTVVYSENFENAPDTGNPQLLTAYTSASPQYPGGTYTADPLWVSNANCNGFVLSSGNSYPAGACGGSSANFTTVRGLAPILGTIGGTPTATNSIVAAYTAGVGGAGNLIQFATASPITLPTASRYLTFSVDAAGRNCQLAASTHPQLRFFVRDSGGVETALGGVIDPCNLADPRTVNFGSNTRGGRYPASGSFLSTSASIGIVMRNVNGGSGGNDGAFDNVQLLDATPDLDKSFGTPNPITGVSRLTLTLTNTSDLATKLGWSGTDTLAPGLVVASPANAATTCTNGAVTANAGGSSIQFAGDLAGDTAHLTSCTFAVDVVPSTPTAQGAAAQTFQNCASNLSGLVGIDAPVACAAVGFPPVAQLSVVKTSTASASTAEGDVVDYSVTVTNTGGSDYTAGSPATMTDDLTGVLDDATYNNDATAASGSPAFASPNLTWSGPLAVGASVTISYSMTVTLDGDGALTNTACVPAGQASGAPCDVVTTIVPIAPSIGLIKSVSPSDPASFVAGQVVTYSFVVTNTGNLVLLNPGIVEGTFDGASGTLQPITCPATPSLAPGAQMTCTATYTIVQTDVDMHSLLVPMTNTATATATASNGAPVVSAPSSAALPGIPAPALTIDKSAGPGGFTAAGQLVTYSFLLTNTGNVTLTGAGVVEGAFTGSGVPSTPVCPAAAASMLPGAQVTCTSTYSLTQADVDAGAVSNQAVATADDPAGAPVTSAVDDATVTIAGAPAITLTKSAGPGGFTAAGEMVAYTFDIVNTGNVTLTSVGVDEVTFSGTGTMSTPVCAPTTLAPTQAATCTATYALTQADVDAGLVSNTATSHGTAPAALGTVTSTPSQALVTVAPTASLSLVKSASRTAVTGAGQQIAYSFVVTNTGTATVSGVSITDDVFTGSGLLPAAVCPAVALAPAASTTCTSSYTTTASDARAGRIDNTATADAVAAGGAPIASPSSSAAVTVDPIAAAIALTGSALAQTGAALAASLLVGGAVLLVLAARRRRTMYR